VTEKNLTEPEGNIGQTETMACLLFPGPGYMAWERPFRTDRQTERKRRMEGQ